MARVLSKDCEKQPATSCGFAVHGDGLAVDVADEGARPAPDQGIGHAGGFREGVVSFDHGALLMAALQIVFIIIKPPAFFKGQAVW